MSKLIVEVCEIKEIKQHNNADSLELVVVKGFQCVTKKGQFKVGDKVVYIPPYSLLTKELSDKMGVTNYLSWQTKEDENKNKVTCYDLGGRTRVAELRGEPSFGILIPCPDNSWEIGKDVAEYYGIKKYTPPFRDVAADAATEVFGFHPYSEIENLRHFPEIFEKGEEIIATEKIHGTNCRVGYCEQYINDLPADIFMAGSMQYRRKIPRVVLKPGQSFPLIEFSQSMHFDYGDSEGYYTDESLLAMNRYWNPLALENVRDLLRHLRRKAKNVVLFGEVFGSSVQKGFAYGNNGKISFRAFDISLDSQYMQIDEFQEFCDLFKVPTVPIIYRGPYDFEVLKKLANGQTTVTDQKQIKEGLVIRPSKEKTHPKIGRVIMKLIGDDYMKVKESGKVSDYTEA